MMHIMKHSILSTLALTAALCAAANTPKSGSLSNNITWELCDSVLTISGQGAMPGYKPGEMIRNPFLVEDFALGVNKIVIGEGITEIGGFSFGTREEMTIDRVKRESAKDGFNPFNTATSFGTPLYANVRTVILPSSLRKINEFAFARVPITSIAFPTGLEDIGFSAFANTSLRTVKLPSGLQRLGGEAFSNCEALTVVDFNNAAVKISKGCFFACSKLRMLMHPQRITHITESAFNDTPFSQLKEEALLEMFHADNLDNYILTNLPDRNTFQGSDEAYNLMKSNIVNTFYRNEATNATVFFKLDDFALGSYSPEAGTMTLSSTNHGTFLLPLTAAQAQELQNNWTQVRESLQPTYYPANGDVQLQSLTLTLPNGSNIVAAPIN